MTTVTEPTLLLDEHIVRQNIQRMVRRAEANNVRLKPHVKTHQSITIGQWMRNYGIQEITVSSVRMAEYFAAAGWDDITIAFPCNLRAADRLNELARDINLSVLISDAGALPKIKQALTSNFNVYIEIDTGAKRTGLNPTDTVTIEKMIDALNESNNLQFLGFYSHPGHSYHCRSKDDIQSLNRETATKMRAIKQHFQSSHPNIIACIGDTPCCSVGDHFEKIEEWSPGNFVFYDLMQQQIGACDECNIALALACPVVAKYPDHNEIAVHGGAVHLSKEHLLDEYGTHYGRIVKLQDDLEWNESQGGCYVKSISQEHGIAACSDSFFSSIEVGDIIGILPVHSCLTADTMRSYLNIESAEQIDHL